MTSSEESSEGEGERPRTSDADIRGRAELLAKARAASMPENLGGVTALTLRDLLRELRVHQIELELQNEQLRSTEALLDVTRARYADLYEHAPVGYLSLDSRGQAVDVNATVVDMLGVARRSIVGAPLSRFILPSEQDEWYFCFRRLSSTGMAQRCEVRLLGKRGVPFWGRLEATLRSTFDGAAARVAIVDVDEQHRAEDERRRSDARYEALFRCSNDALVTLSPPSWRITSANPAALTLFGARTSADLASVALWDHAPGVRGSAAGGAILPAGAGHQGAHRYEWTLKRVSGESFPASITLSHAELAPCGGRLGSQGEARGSSEAEPNGEGVLLAAVRDESDANAMRGALAQADRVNSMGLLAASVAHEINNPLTYVLVMIESLAEWLPRLARELPELSQAVREQLDARVADAVLGPHAELLRREGLRDMADRARGALDATRRIRNITMALGTFARTSDNLDQAVDLHGPIRSALEMAANEIRHRARLCLSLEAVPPVRGSEGQLSQVFLNLLINAVRSFGPDASDDAQITVATWSSGSDVFAEVRDTGVGIPDEEQARVFEPFVSTRPAGLGTGLGLSICRDIVKRHGGEIRLESAVGVGTRVIVRLPVGEPAPHASLETSPRPPVGLPSRRGRVLVVDDEPSLRSVVAQVLDAHEVVLAASGVEAKATLLEDRRFDVILCDLMMPGMSGIDLHRWLATVDPELAGRTIFVTGGAFTPGTEDYLAQTGSTVVQKPFEATDLEALVNDRVLDAALIP